MDLGAHPPFRRRDPLDPGAYLQVSVLLLISTAVAMFQAAVDGEIKVGRTPPTATVVTSLPSPPLSRIVSTMNRESINHYAELLWRNAARGADPRGGPARAAQRAMRPAPCPNRNAR